MASSTFQAKVHTLSTNEQAAMSGMTHAIAFGPNTSNQLSDAVVAEDMVFNLFTPVVASVMVKWALICDPALSCSTDAAQNTTAVSFGDAGSATRFLSAVQVNLNGTPTLYTYGNTAYVYTTGSLLSVLITSMSAKKLSSLDTGKVVLAFQLAPFKAMADVE